MLFRRALREHRNFFFEDYLFFLGGGLYSDELFEDLAREHAHVVRLERLESFSRQVCAIRVLACSSAYERPHTLVA